jgi:hypothetical protein
MLLNGVDYTEKAVKICLSYDTSDKGAKLLKFISYQKNSI